MNTFLNNTDDHHYYIYQTPTYSTTVRLGTSTNIAENTVHIICVKKMQKEIIKLRKIKGKKKNLK